MQRSMWKGVIAFGMVSIPVKLYAATESKDVAFHLLHKECKTRLKQLRWCPTDDREVPWDEIVKGYEYAKDRYVVVTDEDLDRLPVPTKHTIELSAFVKEEEIDPVYYQKSYYLQPDETGIKPYVLLVRALADKGLTALGNITLRTKERICALRPSNNALVLETLFYSDEIRVPEQESREEVRLSERELTMAFTFIELLSASFKPEKQSDQYRQALMQLIEAKIQGKEVVARPLPAPAKVVDLMAALKASVEAAKRDKREIAQAREAKPLERAVE